MNRRHLAALRCILLSSSACKSTPETTHEEEQRVTEKSTKDE